jgi:ATP-dependent RNA helicase DDX27
MLEDGFREELTEIIKSCPRTRQTMLFSATMTENVDDLIRLSLNTPIRLFVDENTAMTKRLVQEFVRVRDETMKLPLLLALIKYFLKYIF